jgi:hypothetical protein
LRTETEVNRNEFQKRGTCISRGNFFGKPVLYRVQSGDSLLIVKDVGRANCFSRWTLGLWLIRKEWKIYSRLAGIEGIPRPAGRIDRFAFAMDFVAGKPLERGEALSPSFWPSLEGILEQIHQRGVVHLDLRHKGNILISPEGDPYLIDFNSSFSFPPGGLLRRLLFPLLKWVDRGGLLKLKERTAPHLMTSEERSFLKRFNRLRKLWIFN